jgi:ribonuclease P protein component
LLDHDHRMRSGVDFRATVRRGAKAAQPTVVVHVLPGADGSSSVGFVVSKSLGSSVARNRVKRRLRHLMRDRVDRLPDGTRVVVRALKPAGVATSATLAEDLDRAMELVVVR